MNQIIAGELTGMRNVVNDTLTQTATIQRPAGVSDGRGQRTDVYSTVASSVPCRVRVYANPGESKLGERTNALTLYAIYFKHDQDVTTKDKIIVSGQTFQVIDIYDNRAMLLQRMAVCSRIQ